jgi:hypothetical protein
VVVQAQYGNCAGARGAEELALPNRNNAILLCSKYGDQFFIACLFQARRNWMRLKPN